MGARSIGYPKKLRIKDKTVFAKVVERDHGVCLACMYGEPNGMSGSAHIHHIKTRGSGGDDTLENLITLCATHHYYAHQRVLKAERLREILSNAYGYVYS